MNHNAKVATPISDALISLWSPYSFATDKAVSMFGLPGNITPVTALAIGYHSNNPKLDSDIAKRDQKVRERKATSEFIIRGTL